MKFVERMSFGRDVICFLIESILFWFELKRINKSEELLSIFLLIARIASNGEIRRSKHSTYRAGNQMINGDFFFVEPMIAIGASAFVPINDMSVDEFTSLEIGEGVEENRFGHIGSFQGDS